MNTHVGVVDEEEANAAELPDEGSNESMSIDKGGVAPSNAWSLRQRLVISSSKLCYSSLLTEAP